MTRLGDLDAAWFAQQRADWKGADLPALDGYIDLLEHAVTALREIGSHHDPYGLCWCDACAARWALEVEIGGGL